MTKTPQLIIIKTILTLLMDACQKVLLYNKLKKIPIAEPKFKFLFRHNAMNLFKLISLTFESKNIAQEAFKNNMYILISMKVI
ncbi:hypothetical protein CAP42_09650 [Acinetobacter indicus]|nr:hypothetical protein VH96_07865 [Acinetobacter indicus]OUY09692.1 hypothetical protein CAP42_09650 [Acinetobacter indicus]